MSWKFGGKSPTFVTTAATKLSLIHEYVGGLDCFHLAIMSIGVADGLQEPRGYSLAELGKTAYCLTSPGD